MRSCRVSFLAMALLLTTGAPSFAQLAPEVGYVFPAGGKAGSTVEVRLGGYNWTPDIELFVLDKRVKLLRSGPPGPILIPEPPYWFGAKGRMASLPLPRETPASFVIPADVPPGPILWQAANANGGTSAGVFIVGAGAEVLEQENRKAPQSIPSLPATVSGRLLKNEEVDRYRITATRDGPITCELMARRLGAKFLGAIEVRDVTGRIVADAVGTNGMDPSLTFAGQARAEYVVAVHDIDFGGDRSYVYRLTVTDGPRVLAAIPAAGRRGETREVEFVGIGLASGAPKLESIKRQVSFPAATGAAFDFRLETPFGAAPVFQMLLSDLPEFSAPARSHLALPMGITGVLERPDAADRYSCVWKKGEIWSLNVEARRIGSPLDVALAIFGPDGKELARNDDLPETTDAGLDFTVPVDGTYQIVVSDMAGKSGSRSANYRLVVKQASADFTLQVAAQRVHVQLGAKFDLNVKANRTGGFQGPIALSVADLPAGISVPANLSIPAGKTDLVVPLQAAKDAAAAAGFVTIVGTADLSAGKAKEPARTVTRTALAPIGVSLSPRHPGENRAQAFFLASTMKPRVKGRPVDQDTGRKVHRGSTFPAEVLVERLEGFQGEIVLQMAANQSYQVQGITGGDVKVAPGVTRTIYPCYMPEWLETTRTSRMGMIAVVQTSDSKGNIRHLVAPITGFVTMTMEGALLKIVGEEHELEVPAGRPFDVHLKVARLAKLTEPTRLELRLPDELTGMLQMEPMTIGTGKEQAVVRIVPKTQLRGLHSFIIRATAMQDRRYPVISEARIDVDFVPAK